MDGSWSRHSTAQLLDRKHGIWPIGGQIVGRDHGGVAVSGRADLDCSPAGGVQVANAHGHRGETVQWLTKGI